MYKINTHNIRGVRNKVNSPDWTSCNDQLCMYVCKYDYSCHNESTEEISRDWKRKKNVKPGLYVLEMYTYWRNHRLCYRKCVSYVIFWRNFSFIHSINFIRGLPFILWDLVTLVFQSANWQLYCKAWHFWGYTYSQRFSIRVLFVSFTVT